MFVLKILACLSLIIGADAHGAYTLKEGSSSNFQVGQNITRGQITTGWSYVNLNKLDDMDFPQFGAEVQQMVPAGKQSKAKVVAYKMATILPLIPSKVTRQLVTSKPFLSRVNGVEFISGKDKVTNLGMKFQGYASLPLNRTLLDLDISFVDVEDDTNLFGYQELVDRFGQGDEQLGLPAKIIVSKAKDLSGGYLFGMYNVFKVYPWGKSEVMLVFYTLSLVDSSNLLIKFAGGGKLKGSLDETSVAFVEELAKTK